jgi:predicted Ser/Thr protein kinase
MISGHLTSEWQHATKKSNKHFHQWATYVITQLWFEIYQIWKQQCATNHGSTAEEQQKRALLRLTPQVTALYNEQQNIEVSDHYLFSEEPASLLSKPIATIKQWLHKATLRVKVGKDRLKQKIKRKNSKQSEKIHPFFKKKQQLRQKPAGKLLCRGTYKQVPR